MRNHRRPGPALGLGGEAARVAGAVQVAGRLEGGGDVQFAAARAVDGGAVGGGDEGADPGQRGSDGHGQGGGGVQAVQAVPEAVVGLGAAVDVVEAGAGNSGQGGEGAGVDGVAGEHGVLDAVQHRGAARPAGNLPGACPPPCPAALAGGLDEQGVGQGDGLQDVRAVAGQLGEQVAAAEGVGGVDEQAGAAGARVAHTSSRARSKFSGA